MNRPFILTGIALSAATAITGCGGHKKATPVAESASPKAGHHRSPAPRPAASATVAGTVSIGKFCRPTGAVGKTANGAWARCLKRPGDTRARWYSQGPARGGVRPGQFCAPAGSTATSSAGKKLTCTKKRGEDRPRWRVK